MASIERSSVAATVARHLGEILEIDPSTVTEDKTFVDDLGALDYGTLAERVRRLAGVEPAQPGRKIGRAHV